MDVAKVILFNDHTPEPLEFSYEDPASVNPFQIASLQGAGAEDIQWGLREAKVRKREIVVRLGLNPNWSNNETYSDLRDQLSRIIQASRSGTVYLGFIDYDGVLVAALVGRVVKMEPDTGKMPDVTYTIECKDTMLRGPELTEVDLTGLDPAETVIHDELSTAPHGVYLAVKFNAAASTFTITNDDGSTFKSTPVGIGGFQVNDILVCSSLHDAKGLVLKRGGTNMPIADSILSGSEWPILFPRPNTIACSGNVSWDQIQYSTAYWGI